MSTQSMSFNLRVWRQDGPQAPGRLVDYKVVDISPEMSFLEMLDELNVQLTRRGERPVEFDSDCREGICGMCGLVITGVPHGPLSATTTCTLRMRHFQNGQTIVIEPFRAAAFPIVRDLVVDRSALDRIIQAGGFVSQNVGSAPDGNAIPVPKDDAENAMDAAVCIGCGACVAACPNASAFLFTSAKVSQLASLPQGRPEARRRVAGMVRQMDLEGFGNCTNHGECEAVCPQEVSIQHIARMRKEYWKALLGWSTRSRASAE
ncbi:MAG: succinate dehydrogenase/fumarate reductase iron-sulfur subunit [Candidatus Xenobium sp.]|jgi:succinate dehydrogenase / fumarate reductase iron-sulfur subunit